jgi:hypothetical protein
MDTIGFHSHGCRVLRTIRHSTTAVDTPRLHPIPYFLLAGRNKKRLCEHVGFPWSQARCEVDCEYVAAASFGCSRAAKYGCTSFRLIPPDWILNGEPKFGYTNRAVWSIGFVAIGLVWPLISWREGRESLFRRWAASCLLTAVFPLLRVDPSESLSTMYGAYYVDSFLTNVTW